MKAVTVIKNRIRYFFEDLTASLVRGAVFRGHRLGTDLKTVSQPEALSPQYQQETDERRN